MAKYKISLHTLQRLFRKLVQAGLMSHFEFCARFKLREIDFAAAYGSEFDECLKCPECGPAASATLGYCAVEEDADLPANGVQLDEVPEDLDSHAMDSESRVVQAGSEFDKRRESG